MRKQGKIIAILVGIAAFASCGREASDSGQSKLDIVGGTLVNAASEVSKSTVALIDLNTGRAFCTGSLIGVKTVLTAAHCVEGVAQTTVKVGVSFGLNASTAKSIPALALKKHPAYKPQLMRLANPVSPPNDIAIVTLSAPAPATHKPVAILSLTNALVVGEPLLLAGYGLTSPSGLDQSGVLRQVTTEITLLSEARKEIEFGNHPGRSACMGDSGGPAFVVRAGKIKLVGVTSRGSFFCDLDGVYTDARYFAAFIAANSK